MFRKPRWSVTWPTRPNGVYTQLVRADDPADAVRVAAELNWPTVDGYAMAFDYTPMVWRLQRPYRWRSRHVAGPDFPDAMEGVEAFAPEPLDLDAIAAEAVSIVRFCDAHDHCKDVARATVGQTIGLLTAAEAAEVLARVTAETREINAYTGGQR